MDINRLLEYLDDEAGQKEQVALAAYRFEQRKDPPRFTSAGIKTELQRSRASVSPSNVSTYLKRLREDGWIKPAEDNSYRLTHVGIDQVEALLGDEALDNPRDEEDLFINFLNFEEGDERYEQLVKDINETYQYRIYDATVVLSRKFFEDMVFQILKTHYAGKDNEKFYDQENGQHYSFDELLSNFKDGVPTLRQYSRELEQELVEDLRDLKDEGNTGAHAIRVDFSDGEVEEWAGDATRMTEIFYEVLLGARIADEQED